VATIVGAISHARQCSGFKSRTVVWFWFWFWSGLLGARAGAGERAAWDCRGWVLSLGLC
jgi:hypothetical protein